MDPLKQKFLEKSAKVKAELKSILKELFTLIVIFGSTLKLGTLF